MFEEVGGFAKLLGVRGSVVAVDAVFIEVEPFEVGFVEQASGCVGAGLVEGVRALEQIEVGVEDFGADLELLLGVGERLLDSVAFGGDGAQPGVDLAGGHGVVGGEVEEAFFASVEVGESFVLFRSEFAGEGLCFGERVGELVGEVVAEGCGCGEVGVVGGDGGFDLVHREVG